MYKMYEGYKVMDEMVYDAIIEVAKTYFENFNNFINLRSKILNI